MKAAASSKWRSGNGENQAMAASQYHRGIRNVVKLKANKSEISKTA